MNEVVYWSGNKGKSLSIICNNIIRWSIWAAWKNFPSCGVFIKNNTAEHTYVIKKSYIYLCAKVHSVNVKSFIQNWNSETKLINFVTLKSSKYICFCWNYIKKNTRLFVERWHFYFNFLRLLVKVLVRNV